MSHCHSPWTQDAQEATEALLGNSVEEDWFGYTGALEVVCGEFRVCGDAEHVTKDMRLFFEVSFRYFEEASLDLLCFP
jgi:hypothetical protein